MRKLARLDETVRFTRAGGGLRITMPESAPRGSYAFTFKLSGVR